MENKVLLTIDLPSATEEQREIFYESLKDAKWEKMTNITTVWKARFTEGVSYESARSTVISDLQSAKISSRVPRVRYNFLISWSDIQSGTL